MSIDTTRGPYDRPTFEIFFNDYKAMNPRVDYTAQQCYLSGVARNTDQQTRHAVNTMGQLNGKVATGRSGEVTVRWNRRDIGKVFAKCKVYVPYTGQQSLAELLPSINAQYPIQLALSDIYNANIDDPVLPLTLTIPMHANNPAFIGAFTLTLGA